MVTRRRARGYTMLEIVIALALFGVFLFIIVTMTVGDAAQREEVAGQLFHASGSGQRAGADAARHLTTAPRGPTTSTRTAVRRLTLIVYTINNDGTAETVVWDFTTPGEAHRKAFKATLLSSDWMARGLPIFTAPSEPMPSGQDAIHVRAVDKENKTCDR